MRLGSTAAFVTARMSSSRFPGKSLAPIGEDVVLGYVTDSLKKCLTVSGVVVVTSTDPTDDPIAGWCNDRGLDVVRGSLNNVAARVLGAATDLEMDSFVRISGDSPLIDPVLVDFAVNVFRGGDWDLVTNVFPRTFPRGQSVEVIRTEVMKLACAGELGDLTASDKEHVTQFFYSNSDRIRIRNFSSSEFLGDSDRSINLSSIHLAVDNTEDLARCGRIIRALGPVSPREAGWQVCSQLSEILGSHSE